MSPDTDLLALAPLDDPFALAQVQSFNSYLCSTVHVAHAHRMRGYRWADDPAALEAMKHKAPQAVAECFALIENEPVQGPWVFSSTYTSQTSTSSPSPSGSKPMASM